MHQITLQEPFRALFYAPFYAALARGAYAKQGVEVRLRVAGRKGRLGRDEATEGLRDKWEGHTHNERNAIGV